MTKLKSLLSLCLVLLLALTGPTGVWAAEPPPSAQAQAVIELIDTGLQDHRQEILTLSQGLTITERERIFFQRQKQPAIGMIGNVVPGFGVGSLLLGDRVGGFVQTAVFFSSIAIVSGILVAMQFSPDENAHDELQTLGRDVLNISMLGVYLFGIIRPAFFVHGYNQDLQAALGYSPTSEETKPQESPPQAPAPEPAPYLDSQGGGGFLWGWVF